MFYPYCDEEALSIVLNGIIAVEKVEELGTDETAPTMTTLRFL